MLRTKTKIPTQVTTPSRIYFLDNIKILLAINVIIFHAALPYGYGGEWPIGHPDYINPLTILIIGTILSVSSSYFMGLFFFIAAYFTPNSYQRKGARKYLEDRLIRLGIPLIIAIISILPFIGFFFYTVSGNLLLQSYWTFFTLQIFSFGYLWFSVVLIFFAIGYVCWRIFNIRVPSIAFPNTGVIVLAATLLGIITFIVRIWYPFDAWIGFHSFKPAQAPMFVFMLISGILAYRNNWLEEIPSQSLRIWGIISIIGILLLPFIFQIFEGNITSSGIGVASYVYALWETFMGISITLSLIILFRDKMHSTGPIISVMANNVYSVYLLNVPIVLTIQLLLVTTDIPLFVKFFIVAMFSIPCCFLLSNFLIRKIPFIGDVTF